MQSAAAACVEPALHHYRWSAEIDKPSTNESRASTRRQEGSSSAAVSCVELSTAHRWSEILHTIFDDRSYHALRTIANNNEASNCYFLLDKNKNKTQARLHLMMKKKKQLTPLQTIEALIPRNFVEDFQKRANRERLDEIAPWRLKLPKFDKSNLSFGNDDPLRMLVAKERIEDLRGNLLCFTDASKTEDGKAGIGIYIPQKDLKLSIRTSSHSSISSTELAAIESCLLHVKESYQGEILNLVIFTDSLSSLMNLKESNNAYNDPDVYRILSTISELQEKGKEVTLVWVPAHVGIPGNEQADATGKSCYNQGYN